VNINRIAILGSGSMGTAILSGLLASGFPAEKVTITTKSASSAARLADELGVNAISQEQQPTANQDAVIGADVVLVAVKPAYVVEVLKEAANKIYENTLVISVAAGTTTASMEAVLPSSVAVVRSMPNTPAIVGRAVTGVSTGSRVSDDQLETALELFETVGRVVVLPESQIDALSTISGSGPAYVFYLIEQLTEAAQNMGFGEDIAAMLVEETFAGATELLSASNQSPAELRRQVTSPNGTTMQAIAVMEKGELATLFTKATEAALARAKEIAAGK
jgi:pyrroline-5-carboxylate reductase